MRSLTAALTLAHSIRIKFDENPSGANLTKIRRLVLEIQHPERRQTNTKHHPIMN